MELDKLTITEANAGLKNKDVLLTFADENVFGWDYGHYNNHGTPKKDVKNAIKYFKSREKKVK